MVYEIEFDSPLTSRTVEKNIVFSRSQDFYIVRVSNCGCVSRLCLVIIRNTCDFASLAPAFSISLVLYETELFAFLGFRCCDGNLVAVLYIVIFHNVLTVYCIIPFPSLATYRFLYERTDNCHDRLSRTTLPNLNLSSHTIAIAKYCTVIITITWIIFYLTKTLQVATCNHRLRIRRHLISFMFVRWCKITRAIISKFLTSITHYHQFIDSRAAIRQRYKCRV